MMKGMILAGGRGTRLQPCTNVTSKALLPVYNRPMIYYPLNTLLRAGITDILFIISPDHAEDYYKLLGDGSQFKAHFSYVIQDPPRGIAEAFIIGESFIGNENITMILGDNIFVDDVSAEIQNFEHGAKIFAKAVSDPKRFGVVEMNSNGKAISIEEKPQQPKSNLCITGLYIYDSRVVEVAKKVMPSERGELEVTDLHRWYMEKGELEVRMIYKEWIDAGTFESLYAAQKLARDELQDQMII
jgi:glucose-1-phosphate thymidylyltransferase